MSAAGRAGPRTALRDRRGFALVVVLWIFLVLFVLGAEFSQGMRQDATAAGNFADETESYYLALAAENLIFYRALMDRELGPALVEGGEVGEADLVELRAEPKGEFVRLRHPDGREGLWGNRDVWVRVTDEGGGKCPINGADETLLKHILANLGVEAEDAATIADSILDWLDADPDLTRANGAEKDYYEPYGYEPTNGPLKAIEELLLVRGVTPELFYGNEDYPVGLRDVFTVFVRGRCKLNAKYLGPAMLRGFVGLDEAGIAEVLALREDPLNSTAALADVLRAKVANPLLAEMIASEDSEGPRPVLLVEAQAKLAESPVKSQLGAVVDLDESSNSGGVHVRRWMDQLPPVEIPPEGLPPGETS